MHELILGGARSGKSRLAERRAAGWLAADRDRRATLVATAMPGDDEMAARIARHRQDRAERVPALGCVEAPIELGAAIERLADARHLLVVDCLTLWLAQCLMPPGGVAVEAGTWARQRASLLEALDRSASPIVLVSNEIGLGGVPMSRAARDYADEIGLLNQDVAARCERVTLMVAGCELALKGQ